MDPKPNLHPDARAEARSNTRLSWDLRYQQSAHRRSVCLSTTRLLRYGHPFRTVLWVAALPVLVHQREGARGRVPPSWAAEHRPPPQPGARFQRMPREMVATETRQPKIPIASSTQPFQTFPQTLRESNSAYESLSKWSTVRWVRLRSAFAQNYFPPARLNARQQQRPDEPAQDLQSLIVGSNRSASWSPKG